MSPLVLIWLLLSVSAAPAQVNGLAAPWREAPEYLALLAPVGERASSYRVYASPLALEEALRRLDPDTSLVHVPGAWQPRQTPPVDAFGRAGRYDRTAMARVYGGRQPHVARGARMDNGRVVESWTLVAPYPDLALTRLETGTLLIVLRLP